jgi:hypothetical protein
MSKHHKFFDYVDALGRGTAAIEEFNNDPVAAAKKAGVTDAQRDALASGHWPTIEAELIKEDPSLAARINPIGWNQRHVAKKVHVKHHHPQQRV